MKKFQLRDSDWKKKSVAVCLFLWSAEANNNRFVLQLILLLEAIMFGLL